MQVVWICMWCQAQARDYEFSRETFFSLQPDLGIFPRMEIFFATHTFIDSFTLWVSQVYVPRSCSSFLKIVGANPGSLPSPLAAIETSLACPQMPLTGGGFRFQLPLPVCSLGNIFTVYLHWCIDNLEIFITGAFFTVSATILPYCLKTQLSL